MNDIAYNDFHNMCRTCMFTSELNPIQEHIIYVLHYLTGIEYSKNDELPQQICLKCIQKLNEIHSFTLQCKQTHINLTKCLINLKNNSNKILNNETTNNTEPSNNTIDFIDIKHEIMDDADTEELSEQMIVKEESSIEINKRIPETNVFIKNENRSYFEEEIHILENNICVTNEDRNNDFSFNSKVKEKYPELSGSISLNESSNSNFMEFGKEAEFNLNKELINLKVPLSDIDETATNAISSGLPEKSRLKYEFTYHSFEKWCIEKKLNNIGNEKVLLAYFEELSKSRKSSSLWSYYSMLRSVLSIKKNVDISKHRNLIAFLKRKSEGYKAKKSRMLTKRDVTKFLTEADDNKYLMLKVSLIIGLSGACRSEDLKNLLRGNVKDEGEVFRFFIPNTKTKIAREVCVIPGDIDGLNLVDVVRKYAIMRPSNTDHNRFFVSYRNGKCTKQPVGIHTFGNIPKTIATFLKLPNPQEYTGHCFRRSSASWLADSGATFKNVINIYN